MATLESILPDEANVHLEQIVEEQHRQAIAERLGQLSVLNIGQVGQPLEHHGNYETTEEEPLPYGQTEQTAGLVTSIAQRANTVAAEARSQSNPEEASPEKLWDSILESELVDIKLAKDAGQQEKTENLLIEHMVSLEMAETKDSSRYDRYEYGTEKSARANKSMLRLAELGLAESAIEVARKAYGLVVATASEPDFFDSRPIKDGKPVVLTHEFHSVAHTFEGSLPSLEVGLGAQISLDPEDPAIVKAPVQAGEIENLDVVDSAIAVMSRAVKTRETGQTTEDLQLIETLNHHAIRGLFDGGNEDRNQARYDVNALEKLLEISPDIVTDAKYETDFAFLRQHRLVDSNYRINNMFTARLDSEIILLVGDDKLDLAKRLITANEAELTDPRYPESNGVLGSVMRYHLEGQFTETQQEQIVLQLKAMHAEKIAALGTQLDSVLNALTLSDGYYRGSLKNAVVSAHDPESALHCLQALQKATPENFDQATMEQIAYQLLEQTGSNNSTVLDEMGASPDILAPLFFNDNFRNLGSQNYGRTARNIILRHPDRAEQMLRIFDHPMLQSMIEDSYGSPVIAQVIEQTNISDEALSRLDELTSLNGLLNADQLSKILIDDNAIRFARLLTKAEAESPFLSELNAETLEIVVDIGLQTAPDMQERVMNNALLFDEAIPMLTLLRDAGVTADADIIKRSLLQAEDLSAKSVEFSKAFTDTKILKLIGINGPAFIFDATILNLLANAESPFEAAQQTCEQLLSNDPLWLRCYKISQIGVGNIEEVGFQTGLNIKEIPLSLPVPDLNNDQQMEVLHAEAPTPFAELNIEQKRGVAYLEELTDAQVEALHEVAFSQLAPEYQRTLLAFRLFETIALSRDLNERQEATERNISKAYGAQWLESGDLVHATNTSVRLRAIITSGALAGETIGYKGKKDSYPFNLDTVVVSEDVTSQPDYVSQLGALKNGYYGQIAIVFGRGSHALHAGEEFKGGMNTDHRLLLGGLPSTEITALLLRGDASPEIVTAVKRVVVESDMYIPIVSPDGTLLLTSEEFTQLQADSNIHTVQPQIVDGSFERANSKAGSNEGAEFIVPQGADKEPQHWYVKFGDDNPDRMWTEILADKFYRTVVPDVVPETQPIIVEGRLARASRIVPIDAGSVTNEARNEAFIMDCILGNWDAVYNNANIVMSGGHGLRIDTGNSFDFRARGDKKPEGTFTETVQEIEIGSDQSNLGAGMRQVYPDLTDDQIDQQVERMQERLPNEVIDQLVDSIRRPSAERSELKRIIKSRRDYIINYFSREEATAA